MGTALERGKLGDAIVEIFISLQRSQGVSLRGLSRESGVKLGRLGNILSRNYTLTIDEIGAISTALNISAWEVVAAAEWMVYGQPPEGLTRQEQIDVAALFEAASRYQDKDYATPAAPKPTPLFSDRRNDGYYGNEALPRMA